MGIREKINTNQWFGFVLVLLVSGVSFFLLLRQSGGDKIGVYFIDLNTSRLVIRNHDTPSPDPNASGEFTYPDEIGGSIVRINMYQCGEGIELRENMSLDEVKALGAHPVWIERYPEEVIRYMERLKRGETLSQEEMRRLSGAQKLVASPDSPDEWFLEKSRHGQALVFSIAQLCGGDQLRLVKP